MADIKKQETDIILSSDELKKLEKHQSLLAESQAELQSYAAEFEGIINRHYFNRENGFLDDQQKNLREVAILQGRIEKLMESLNSDSKELKSFMLKIQERLHTDFSKAPAGVTETTVTEVGEKPPAEVKEKETAAEKSAVQPPSASSKDAEAAGAAGGLKDTPLVLRGQSQLMAEKTAGGEISIKVLIMELRLREPDNRNILYQIDTQLKELLYNRKLIGYSATAMVFGRDRTLAQLFEDLQPIFLSDAVRELLVQGRYVGRDEVDKLRLACDKQRELVYQVT